MALPAHVLERLPSALLQAGLAIGVGEEQVLPLGVPALESVLPGGGLTRGAVTELTATGPALGTRLALTVVAALQREGVARGGEAPWCAFVDPGASLYAPGVAQQGVLLDRLLVVQPSVEALLRSTLRLVESQAFAAVVVDTLGVPGAAPLALPGDWPRAVRRLSQAVSGSGAVVLLLTDASARRSLPLPVAQRLRLRRGSLDELTIEVVKDRRGRVQGPERVRWPFGVEKPGLARTSASLPEGAAPERPRLRLMGA